MNENFVIDEKLVSENSDFLKAVAAAKTVEEAQSICAEYNIELPKDAWEEIQRSYQSGKLGEGELSDDDLDAVSGGRILACCTWRRCRTWCNYRVRKSARHACCMRLDRISCL